MDTFAAKIQPFILRKQEKFKEIVIIPVTLSNVHKSGIQNTLLHV